MHKAKRHAVSALTAVLLGLSAVVVVLTVALLWPYDDVRFPAGPEGHATPMIVEQGGTVTITRPEFCNDNQDIRVTRWAERYDDAGRISAAFELPAVEFYNGGQGLQCFAPSMSSLTLPNYVIGPNGAASVFRLRFETTYRPNAVRVVSVSSWTTRFTVVPSKGAGE